MSATLAVDVDRAVVVHGNCLTVLAGMPDCSVDSIVCDPPYGLDELPAEKVAATLARWLAGERDFIPDGKGFMSRDWDSFVPPPAVWDECLRILKPGGHLLAFAGSRTVDLMGLSIRLAGFEMRDSIAWIQGASMPHGLDIGKAVDARLGAQREVIPVGGERKRMIPGADQNRTGSWVKDNGRTFQPSVSEPVTDEARQWDGWHTALKPAVEPIVVARKPFPGAVVDNVLAHGTGGLNIDACRIPVQGARPWADYTNNGAVNGVYNRNRSKGSVSAPPTTQGRFPANVMLTHSPDCLRVGSREIRSNSHQPAARGAGGIGATGHAGQTDLVEQSLTAETVEVWNCTPGCPVAVMDGQSGEAGAQGDVPGGLEREHRGVYGQMGATVERAARGDSGGASRFFHRSAWSDDDIETALVYVAKASAGERPEGADGLRHVSVKPLALMRELVRLVTPPGGVVVDPFCGSGTTVEAALIEGFWPIAVEQHAPYLELIEQRIERWRRNTTAGVDPDHERYFEQLPTAPAPPAIEGQMDMFAGL